MMKCVDSSNVYACVVDVELVMYTLICTVPVYPDLLYLDNYSWTPPLGVSPQDMAVALLAPHCLDSKTSILLFPKYRFNQSTLSDFVFDI